MKFLTIFACADAFSHTPMRLQVIKTTNDYTENDLLYSVRDYQNALKTGGFSKLAVHLIDVNPDTGEVTVEINRMGENPLKTKKIINPEAQKVREERLSKVSVKPKGVYTPVAFPSFDDVVSVPAPPTFTVTGTQF
jgi:hypothetical protein